MNSGKSEFLNVFKYISKAFEEATKTKHMHSIAPERNHVHVRSIPNSTTCTALRC